MSEIFAPGSVAGPAGPSGAAGSLANVKSLTDTLLLATENIFNYAMLQTNFVTASDGTVAAQTGAGGSPSVVTGLMYCPGAVGLVCNSRIATAGFGPGAFIQLFDANGNYTGNATDPGGYQVTPGTTITLPGTQTYVRLTMGEGFGDWQGANTMICAGASPSIPGSFQPFGLDTVADVNAKDAVVAATAQTNLLAALITVPAEFAAAALPGNASLGLRNAFNFQAIVYGSSVNTDGSSTTGTDHNMSVVYCPGATSFITNLPIEIANSEHNICTYDAEGNFLANINANITSTIEGGYVAAPGVVFALPGNQTYVKFVTHAGAYGSYGIPGAPQACVFYAGTTASPCPTSLTAANQSLPFGGFASINSRTATELGADPSQSLDATTVLNTFLANAASTNPIELVLDGNFLTSGLVLSPNGFTTIRGLGAGTGITLVSDGVQDGIRIGAYTAETGNSEGTTHGATPPTRAAQSIILRDFQVWPSGQQNAAANQPVSGAIAHGTYGIILANATDITVDNVTFASNCANYCVTLSNVDHVNVRNCNFTTTGTLHDGVHIDGPAEKIHISRCTFATGDDGIALNAYEGWGGDITDVTIDSCIFVNALTLMRAYGSSSSDSTYMWKVRRVAVSNCVGTVGSCVASLGLGAGECNESNVDEIRDITFSNCDIQHNGSYNPFLLCCTVKALKINNHIHRPNTTATLISSTGSSIGSIIVNNLTIVRGDNAHDACAIVDIGSSTCRKLTLQGISVVDQAGSSYAALPYVVGAAAALTELVIDSVDMDSFTALFDSNGTTNITTIKGCGLLSTGTALPDAVMANDSFYLSSTDSGAPSLKVGGTAKRLTLT